MTATLPVIAFGAAAPKLLGDWHCLLFIILIWMGVATPQLLGDWHLPVNTNTLGGGVATPHLLGDWHWHMPQSLQLVWCSYPAFVG